MDINDSAVQSYLVHVSIKSFLSFFLAYTAIQFSFGHPTIGSEGQSTLGVIVPVVLSINTSTAVLPADTTVVILVQPNGSATCRSTVSLTCCNYTYICPVLHVVLNQLIIFPLQWV